MPDRTQQPRQIDAIEPCFVRMRTEKGGPWYGARVYRALGILRGEINNEPADPEQVWTSGDLITREEYDTLLRVANSPKPF